MACSSPSDGWEIAIAGCALSRRAEVLICRDGGSDNPTVRQHERDRVAVDLVAQAESDQRILDPAVVADDRHETGDELGVPFGTGQRPAACQLTNETGQRYEEGEHDHGRDRQSYGDEAPSHCSGGTSFTPTPRLVWM